MGEENYNTKDKINLSDPAAIRDTLRAAKILAFGTARQRDLFGSRYEAFNKKDYHRVS